MTPAPLAVEAAALHVALLLGCRAWPERGVALIGTALVAQAAEIAIDAGVAVSHRDARREALQRVDHGLIGLRVLLTAAGEAQLIDTPTVQRHAESIRCLGRMVGGWRKHLRRAAKGRGG